MLTIKEAAEYADKSVSWIRKKILANELEAEKKPFKYGKRWETTKKAIDDLLQQAKMEKEVVEVREIDKPVDKEQLVNDLLEATQSQNKELIDEAVSNINENINTQNKQLQEQIKQQNKAIEKLTDKVEDLEEEKEKTFIDKIKNIFMGN